MGQMGKFSVVRQVSTALTARRYVGPSRKPQAVNIQEKKKLQTKSPYVQRFG
jgi:hypothetical protein